MSPSGCHNRVRHARKRPYEIFRFTATSFAGDFERPPAFLRGGIVQQTNRSRCGPGLRVAPQGAGLSAQKMGNTPSGETADTSGAAAEATSGAAADVDPGLHERRTPERRPPRARRASASPVPARSCLRATSAYPKAAAPAPVPDERPAAPAPAAAESLPAAGADDDDAELPSLQAAGGGAKKKK